MSRQPQSDKFTPATLAMKDMLREWRIGHALPMTCLEDADVSRKKLEDFEAVRDYGCFFSLDDLVMFCEQYELTMTISADEIRIQGPNTKGDNTEDMLIAKLNQGEG